jgi:ketosteroid isomerase-like protein
MGTGAAELHRRIYEAFNARDTDALIALCDPGVEIHSVFGAVSGSVYRGHGGVRRWQRDLNEAWGDGIHVEVDEMLEKHDRALAFDVLHGRGRQSGAEVALPGAALTRWHDGCCVYFRAYADREDARKDWG